MEEETYVQSAEESVEAEWEYRRFVQARRGNNTGGEQKNSEEEAKSNEFNSLTACVEKIQFLEWEEKIEIHFRDESGKRHTDSVRAALPEDSGSKLVRLCEFVGVDPESPAGLRGEEIPTKRVGGETKIDYPPVQKRLNPYRYRLRRSTRKGLEVFRRLLQSSSILRFLSRAVIFVLPAVLLISCFLAFFWIKSASEAGGLQQVFAFAMFPFVLLTYFLSAAVSLNLYVRVLASGSMRTLHFVYRLLFPKS